MIDLEPIWFQYRKASTVDGVKLGTEIWLAQCRRQYEWLHEVNMATPWLTCQIFVYSITSRTSFEAMQALVSKAQAKCTEWATDKFGVVVGNKCDVEAQRQVSTREGREFADQFDNLAFYETSALHNINIEAVFDECGRMQMRHFVGQHPELLEHDTGCACVVL